MNPKEIREKLGQLAAKMRELTDLITAEERAFTAEEDATWQQLNADYDELRGKLEIAERMASVSAFVSDNAAAAAVAPGREPSNPQRADVNIDEQRRLAFNGWGRFQLTGEVREDERDAAAAVGLNPMAQSLNIPLLGRQYRSEAEIRTALSAITGAAGGFTVPEGFVRDLEVALLAYGGIREVATVIRTDSGNPLPWPTVDDTDHEGERKGESAAATEDTDLATAFGQVVFGAHKYSSKLILVPEELLEDSAFDMASFIASAAGERIGRVQADDFTTGDGAAKPYGIMSMSTSGKTTAAADAIDSDELFDLLHSVDPAYRNAGAGWMMHDSILLAVRKLADGEGQYLWQPGLQNGTPDRLLGYPIQINQSMASSLTATYKTVAFGRLAKYQIRDVRTIQLRKLVERYAEYQQVGFIAWLRSDGALLDAGTHPVKHLTQHA